MAVAVYYVMRSEEGWVIRFGDRHYGHSTLTAALRSAISAARDSSQHGHESQVLVQWPDGAWVVSWASEDNLEPVAEPPQG